MFIGYFREINSEVLVGLERERERGVDLYLFFMFFDMRKT